MPDPTPSIADRRAEAERFIDLARALLHRPEEEMAASHLDHAIEALHILSEGCGLKPSNDAAAFNSRATARAPNHG
jgi:hypothetical protein